MASAAWTDEDRAVLEGMADRRDWIVEALKRFPNRTEASVRCMMQKIRSGSGQGRYFESAWMADAANGSRRLLEALQLTGERPT